MNGVVIAETVRRQMTSVLVVALVGLLAMIGLTASRADNAATVWPALVTLLTLIVSSGLIGPEFSSGTLQLILVKPVGRSAYVLSRVAGVVLVIWIAIAVAALGEIAGRMLWADGRGVAQVGIAALNAGMRGLMAAALFAFLGSFTRAYLHLALYFLLLIGLEMITGFLVMLQSSRRGLFAVLGSFVRDHPVIPRAVLWLSRNLFPEPPREVNTSWLLMVASNAALALLVACLLFRRREVPYGAD